MRPITRAWSDWLSDRVERQTGRPSGPEPRAATDAIAKKLIAEDLPSALPSEGRETVGIPS